MNVNQSSFIRHVSNNLMQWFDTSIDYKEDMSSERFNWLRNVPFILLHLLALLAFWVEFSPVAIVVCLLSFWLRMFAITGFYHRYFAHKTFQTSRVVQFLFALIGNMSAQRGPLWWAGHHRAHHKYSDTEKDLHSPEQRGFWWSHMGWFTCDASFATPKERIKDWLKFPELVWLDRFDSFAPFLLIGLMFVGGQLASWLFPSLETSGLQWVVWGFFVSTVLLSHATFTINSLGHVWGKKRFKTNDDSRNNGVLALITLGEGWHNNHHRWSASARQGFYWWEIDITYIILKLMSYVGLVWDIKPVPQKILDEGRAA